MKIIILWKKFTTCIFTAGSCCFFYKNVGSLRIKYIFVVKRSCCPVTEYQTCLAVGL
jgi:hypothetical protein